MYVCTYRNGAEVKSYLSIDFKKDLLCWPILGGGKTLLYVESSLSIAELANEKMLQEQVVSKHEWIGSLRLNFVWNLLLQSLFSNGRSLYCVLLSGIYICICQLGTFQLSDASREEEEFRCSAQLMERCFLTAGAIESVFSINLTATWRNSSSFAERIRRLLRLRSSMHTKFFPQKC